MQVRKMYYNKRTLTISVPKEVAALVGAQSGDYFRVGVNEMKQIVLTPVRGTGGVWQARKGGEK